jgi:serine/threonine-protein kinase
MAGMPTAPTMESFDAEVDPLLGRVINDRYKITEAVGHGGMGKVYKALQAPLDRVVALKVLGAGHDRDPNFYKRFFLEASVTAKLTHPNTITLFDYGRTEDGIFFIAMEFLTGRTLSQVMQAEGPLAQERVIHIAQQICRSLREAHALGIIHRDMKPANVMLMRQHDDHDFCKVLDFGLVKFFSGDNPEGDITNAGTFMGSPHYIAPEQARNQNPDQRCDIYSLGVLIYHMLTGRVPFTAQNPVDIILKHLHDPPVPLTKLRPDLNIDPALEEVVLKCLAKDREQRFQSMDELLGQLKRVRAALTGVSGPLSMPPPGENTGVGLAPVRPGRSSSPGQTGQGAGHTPPSMRTPSGPMPELQTPQYGVNVGARAGESAPLPSTQRPSMPPPPPADISGRNAQVGEIVVSPVSPIRRFLPLGAGVVVAAAVVAYLLLRGPAAVQVVPVPPLPPAPQAALPAAPVPAVAAPAIAPATPDPVVPSALANTTLLLLTSTPTGAEVRDVDDRMLGVTPFEMRVPSNKPLALTLKAEGYKPLPIKQKVVSGERLALSGTLKKDPKSLKADALLGGKRSVGYKDDPY